MKDRDFVSIWGRIQHCFGELFGDVNKVDSSLEISMATDDNP